MQSSHIVNQEVNFDNSKESQANTNKHDQNHNLTLQHLYFFKTIKIYLFGEMLLFGPHVAGDNNDSCVQ